MSSYALTARFSNIDDDTSDLQTEVDELRVNKQDTITNAGVAQGQAVLDGVSLKKIVTKDNTLVIEGH